MDDHLTMLGQLQERPHVMKDGGDGEPMAYLPRAAGAHRAWQQLHLLRPDDRHPRRHALACKRLKKGNWVEFSGRLNFEAWPPEGHEIQD